MQKSIQTSYLAVQMTWLEVFLKKGLKYADIIFEKYLNFEFSTKSEYQLWQ